MEGGGEGGVSTKGRGRNTEKIQSLKITYSTAKTIEVHGLSTGTVLVDRDSGKTQTEREHSSIETGRGHLQTVKIDDRRVECGNPSGSRHAPTGTS